LQEKVCQGYPLTLLLLFKPYPLLLPDCTDMLCYCYWCLLWLLLLVLLVMLVLVLVLVAVLLLDALLLLPLLVALMLSLLAIPSGMHALAWRWLAVGLRFAVMLAVCFLWLWHTTRQVPTARPRSDSVGCLRYVVHSDDSRIPQDCYLLCSCSC